jgi:ArsR family transcriptional regulator
LTGALRAGLNHYVLISAITDEVIRALADPLRARIVELLAEEQLCTCHLVELTGGRQTNISNHLRVLREAGLVEAQPAGRYTYYRLLPEALAAVADHYAALAERAREAAQLRRPCA